MGGLIQSVTFFLLVQLEELKILRKKESALFTENMKGKNMKYRDFDRKRRYGIRKFAVGTASVLIGTVIFGVNPVLAQEQANAAGANTETVEPGQGLSELPKEASSGDLAHLDKDLAGKLAAAQDNGVEVDQEHLKKNESAESETPSSTETPAEEANKEEESEDQGAIPRDYY